MDFDVTPEPLFRAVGRAMSSWERLEAHLSYLYSILVKKPMQIEALQAYGRDQRIFDLRMKALKKAADGYEILSPSQERESLLDSLIGEARQLSTCRNQIAHGVVTPVQTPPLNMPLEPWPEPTWIYVLKPLGMAFFISRKPRAITSMVQSRLMSSPASSIASPRAFGNSLRSFGCREHCSFDVLRHHLSAYCV